MKKLYIIPLISFLFAFSIVANSQTIYFEDDFESGNLNKWTQEYVAQTWKWKIADGTGNSAHPPNSAHAGSYNAAFFRDDGSANITKLITSEFNLEFAIKPELTFYLSQYYFEDPWGTGNSKMSLYYRSSEIGNQWVKLKEYNEAIDGWEKQVVLIPDSVNYTSVQLAFEARFGDNEHGLCIDDIQLIETGVIPKYLDAISAVQASQDVIPTSSSNNPILRLKFTVKGNDGVLNLDSLVVDALDDAEYVVADNGVKLFATKSINFYDTVQIGTASTFENGKAIFNSIGYDLPFGNTYIWVAYDIPVDETNKFKGKIVDAKILVNNIKINNNYYSDLELNPYGNRKINKSLFFDNFEGENFWILSGEFEVGKPKECTGHTRGNPDPTYAFSGKNVLGSDLTGLGDHKGAYELNIAENSDIAETDTILNAKYYKNIRLGFYRWLNAKSDDNVSIEVSLDGGNSWSNIWKNEFFYLETKFSYKSVGLGNVADRQKNLLFRYVVGPTGAYSYSGWNIDNFAITGTFIDDDAGFVSLLSPQEGCGHIAPEPLEIAIQNYGYSPTNDTVPVGYSTDGGNSWIKDTIFRVIPRDDTVHHIFTQLIDLTEPGYHNILVKTFYPGDEDTRNDMLDTTLFITPTYTLPYSQNFESSDDFWRSLGKNETWEYGEPTDTIIENAYSGANCWATNLGGNYPNNDSSWLVSPCFDFTNIDKPIFECMLWADAEKDNDGMALYYSLNEGDTWVFIPTEITHSFDWDWYNNTNITALGTAGWDTVDAGWFLTRQILPNAVANKNGVKFKILFTSNNTITDAGFAIDDISIYDAPTDAGVTAIALPTNSCSLSKTQHIKIAVKNYGIRTIKSSDPIYVSLDYNGETVLTDTFNLTNPLAINDMVQLQFTDSLDMFDKKGYDFIAYTHIPIDTAFYVENVYNDTLIDTVWVYGEPYFTLGPDIGTLVPENEILTVDTNFINYVWTNHYNDTTHVNDTFPVPAFPGGVEDIDFSVKITNDSSCIAIDTIKVIWSISDLGVTAAIGTIDTCINKQTKQYLQFTVMNYSADTTYINTDKLEVGYQFDGGEAYTELFAVGGGTMAQFESRVFTFVTPPVFPDSGNYVLKVFSVIYADLDYSNDTTEMPIYIFPLPEVEIGQDTVFTVDALNEIDSLNAYSDYFESYNWHDSSTDSIFHLTNNLTYKYFVEVADTNSCGTASDTVHVVADNWVVDTITSPVNSCTLLATENITVVIKNNSPNIYPINYELLAEITVDNSTKMDTIVLSEELAAFSDISYTFTPNFDMSEPKEYDVKIEIFPELDIITTDNKLSEKINTWGVYPVDIGPDSIVTKRADTVIFDAEDKYITYEWQDNSTDRYFYVQSNKSLKYYVDVDDEHGCSNSSDTVRIVSYDIGVTEILTPSGNCDLVGTNRIRFTLQNFGYDDIPTGTKMLFYYNINNGNWVELEHTLNSDLEPETSTNIIIFEDIEFDNTQTYTMNLCSKWNRDHFYENDTATKIIYEFETPVVELGEDIYTTKADTVIIDGGENHTTYTWNDGLGDRYYNVSKTYSEKYFVTVTNSYGCFDSDSVNVFTYDIGVDSIYGLNNCEVTASNTPTISIKLHSTDTLKAGDKITAEYNFAGNIVSETVTLTDTFTSAATLPYTFTTPFAVTDIGNYTITCMVTMENEVVTDNNSLEGNFKIGSYLVNLGDDVFTYDESTILDAGAGFTGYLWSDDSEEQTLEVTEAGKYLVTITDINGCNASDSINVTFLNPLYEITEILGIENSCSHSENESISFVLKNAGNDTIFTNRVIPISFEIDSDGEAVEENYTFTQNLTPDNSVTINFTATANLSEVAEHTIDVSATISTATTTLDSTINTWGYPDVDLGDDINTGDETAILDAGENFTSYLWNTGATTQTITVDTDGDYWVLVTNSHNCENSDTISVNFLQIVLTVNKFIKPLMGCSEITNEEVTIVVKNTGSKIVPAGTIIDLGYKVEDEDRIDETITFANDMQPNANLNYDFTNLLTIEESGNFNIKFFIRLEDEDIDIANYVIPIYEKPVFFGGEDTIKVEEYPYLLDPQVTADSYLWTTGQTTQTIIINNNGNYGLTIVEDNTCEFSETVNVTNISGINDTWARNISIYPNPGETEIWVNLPQNLGEVTIKVADLTGKTMFFIEGVSEKIKLNISEWEQGAYILRISNSKHYGIYQIIKQ